MKLKHKGIKQLAGKHTDDQGAESRFQPERPGSNPMCLIIVLDLFLLDSYVPTNWGLL